MTLDNSFKFYVLPNAIKRILELKTKAENVDKFLRIKVLGGGCSGFQYNFALDSNLEEDDFRFSEDEKLLVAIDKVSLDFLANCSLDFVQNLGGSFFKIENPNATANCGCGNSFSV